VYAPLDSEALFSSAFMEGPLPWAVWTAILASKDKDGLTSLNPTALARMWRVDEEEVQKAWDVHTSPDPKSKNKEYQGRRLIPTEDGRWLVVSHAQYRERFREEKRREQLRLAKQRQREREKREKIFEKGAVQESEPSTEREQPEKVYRAPDPNSTEEVSLQNELEKAFIEPGAICKHEGCEAKPLDGDYCYEHFMSGF